MDSLREDAPDGEGAPYRRPTITMESDAITLSEAALAKVLALRSQEEPFLRLAVEGGGCGGFRYSLSLERELLPGDSVFPAGEIDVVVDELSFPYLRGSRIDFEDGLNGQGFRVENPNARASCGCGQSFRIDDDACEAGFDPERTVF
jgi:iron-sulfur cluster assembly accessory protein